MRVDLHVHTCYSVDGWMTPEEIVSLLRRRRLGALAITDHNTIEGAIAVREIASFPVIVGQEISTADGELMGLFLQEEVPRALSALETVNRIKRQGGLVGVPHPFDRFRPERLHGAILEDLAGGLDFVEALNARVTFWADNLRAERFALEKGLLRSAGSDAHSRFELGRAYVEMESFDGRDQFVQGLGEGSIGGAVSPFWVHFLSILAKARRKLRRS